MSYFMSDPISSDDANLFKWGLKHSEMLVCVSDLVSMVKDGCKHV